MFFNKKCCSSSALFSTFLCTTIQEDCKRRTLFRVFSCLRADVSYFLCCTVNFKKSLPKKEKVDALTPNSRPGHDIQL